MPNKFFWLCVFFAQTTFAAEPEYLTYSSGTGFFVSRDGLLLTNYHVVSHCKELTAYGAVPEGPAKVVAVDALYDLALVKADALPLGVAEFNSQKQPLQKGDRVVVVGYPGQAWQTGQTVTREGTILHTTGPRGEEKWMQFSDTLAQGNSGGPLLDKAGHVVGVVTAKGRLVRDNADMKREEVEHFDLAMSLPVIREFLAKQDVRLREADSDLYQSAGQITEMARLFVVNVRCKWDEQRAQK